MRGDFRSQFYTSLLLFLLGFPPSVYAAELAAPLNIPLIKYGFVILMAFWGAFAALLQRLAKGEEARLKIVVARDIVNATLAAFLTFLVCEHFSVPPALEAVYFTVAGYGGARFMEMLYSKFVARAVRLLDSSEEKSNG